MGRIRRNYDVAVARGTLSAFEAEQRNARVEGVQDYAAIRDCDVVIESVYEDLDTKRAVFVELDAVMKPGALLLTNTSAFDIDLVADATARPQNVAGAHFFSPANVMKLLEVVHGARTSPSVLRSVVKFGRRLGKTCVTVGNCDGFLTTRSRAPLLEEMQRLLEEGALPRQVDRALIDFGFPMGPFAVMDLAGLDIAHATRAHFAANNPAYRAQPIADQLLGMGRLGQKTGAGWYRYDEGNRTPHPDPIVTQLIGEHVARSGRTPREIPEQEILHRLLFSAINECCRILEQGLLYRASDIDVAWIHGFGFPRYRGGPMFWADSMGSANIVRQLDEWRGAGRGERWTPAPLLVRVAQSGELLHALAGRSRS